MKPQRQAALSRRISLQSSGFAIITVMALMALIVILLLAVAGLSSTASRTARTGAEMRVAQANAQLALGEALGELQTLAGQDTRITASSEAVAGVNGTRFVTGVWRSWEGTDHDVTTGLPKAPDYSAKLQTGDTEVDTTSSGRFLGWLLSGPEKDNDADAPPSLVATADTVPLLGEGTLGTGTDQEVHVVPSSVGDEGAYAWWVEGENSKALITEPADQPTTEYEWSQRLASGGTPSAEHFGFDDPSQLGAVPSRRTLDLVSNTDTSGGSVSGKNFHEMTPRSVGLLTNSANGGWRRDLSLMSEQWNSLSATGLPFFTLEPGQETAARKTSGVLGGLIYPWASQQKYLVIGTVQNNNISRDGGASVGWSALVDFALSYRKNTSGSSLDSVTFPLVTGGRDLVGHRPLVARIHWVFSYGSKKVGNEYQACLVGNPVITFWNPYNVELADFEEFQIRLQDPLPYGFKFNVGGTSQQAFYSANQIAGDKELTLLINPLGQAWKPGESRVYSGNRLLNAKRLRMRPGFQPANGFKWPLFRSYTLQGGNYVGNTPLTGPSDAPLTVELKRYAPAEFNLEIYSVNGQTPMASEVFYELPTDVASSFWPDLTVTDQGIRLADVQTDPSPFFTALMQHRSAFAEQSTHESTTARGYSDNKSSLLFTSPKLYKAGVQGQSYFPEPYPDGFPYDWLFFTPNDINDTEGLPASSGSLGFLGTGFRADVGLVNLVTSELPLRPLTSLGDLQQFDINYFNPLPPYTANAIGNSNATFAIKPNEVYIDDSTPAAERSSFDHSYVSNHIFFDDWFVSSIAPDVPGTRSVTDVYRDFVAGDERLINAPYRPVKFLSDSDAQSAASDLLSDNTAWHNVASKLEVDGMFNVNSTSVEAWTALLKHMDAANVPYLAVLANSWEVRLEDEDDHPVSRTTIAGDPQSRPLDPDISKLATHRRLTDEHLEALATEIVEQVKKRGPFLSLSEFVNRQLVDDDSPESLALAGSIEAALIQLSTAPATENPNGDLQGLFPDQVLPIDGITRPFDEASKGYRAYGFPGWIRQADILRPLAPIMSARDDTFVIRAYGESTNPATGEPNARAWCEAVVQRQADYVESAEDDATVLPGDSALTSEANKRFGRGFKVISFKWLSPEEV